MVLARKTDHSNEIKTFYGATIGEWIGIMIFIIGFATNYAVTAEQTASNKERSEANESEVQQIRVEVVQKIRESEHRTELQIKESEQRTRSDIRELRQIMLRNPNERSPPH